MNINVFYFLLFFASSIHACYSQSQQYKPSQSELSGNGPSCDGKGYIYNFRGNLHTNCNHTAQLNDAYNQFKSKNYSYTIDTLNGYFSLSFNGEQEKTEVLCNHFTGDDCFFIESSSTGPIDLSNPEHNKITARLKSNVAVEEFGMYILTVNEQGLILIGDGSDHVPQSLKPGAWTTFTTDAIFTLWNNTALDPKKVVGIAFYARNSTGMKGPKGTIDIDYVKIGSAALPFQPFGLPAKEGYTYEFSSTQGHFCQKQINTLNNRLFSLSVDALKSEATLTQVNTDSRYNLFAMEFTDQDCFITTISLENKNYRFAEIKIKPDRDIHTFSMSISGDRVDNMEWDYSIPVESVALKGNEWNIVRLPVDLASNGGSSLMSSRIRGIVFAFNHHSEKEASSTTVNYLIDYIKIGNALETK